jgi:hypothetical protein
LRQQQHQIAMTLTVAERTILFMATTRVAMA